MTTKWERYEVTDKESWDKTKDSRKKSSLSSIYFTNNFANFKGLIVKDTEQYIQSHQYGLNIGVEDVETSVNGWNLGINEASVASYDAFQLDFDLPDYGVEDYIMDKTRFVKGMTNLGNEPGWFYFKVMFKFNTNYGLFGGILGDGVREYMSSNSALRYLWMIEHWYNQENIGHRMTALFKFTSMLSELVTKYPWCIKAINNLNQTQDAYIKDFSKEKSIELVFNTETTDFRLGTLLDLYKYICYDDINCKEILPENLRKFDMSIVLFHVPIRYFQTAIMVAPKKNISTGLFGGKFAKVESIIEKVYNYLSTTSTYYKYKRMSDIGGDFSNMMSFRMLTFNNCEFNVSSFGKYYEGGEINNEKAFQLGTSTSIKINYDRVYYHNMNEWNEMFFGSDGFKYNKNGVTHTFAPQKSEFKPSSTKNYWRERLQSIKEAKEGAYFFDKNADQYKALIDYSEYILRDGLMSMDMEDYYAFIKGNIYGNSGISSDYFKGKMEALTKGTIKSGNLYGKKLGPGETRNGYFENKIKDIYNGTIQGNLYDRIYGRLGSGNNRTNSDYLNTKLSWLTEGNDLGNLYGKKLGPGSEYSNKKLNAISNGVISGNIFDEIKITNESLSISDFTGDAGLNQTDHNLTNIQDKAPLDEYNENSDPNEMLNNTRSKINSAKEDPLVIDQVVQRKREIWNYELTGSSSSSSVGGAMDAIGDIASFWKW